MPSKPITAGKPSWYLDHSTLCDAIRAHFMDEREGSPHYRRLLQIIVRVANEANLCIGWPHVHEFAAWNERKAQAATEWLDALPFVWMHETKRVMDSEVEAVLRGVVGAAPFVPQPFSPSFLATFDRLTPDALSEGLGRTSLPQIVADAKSQGGGGARWGRESIRWATALNQDRQDRPRPEPDKRKILTEQTEQALRESVVAVHTRLVETDPGYAAIGGGVVERARRVVHVYRSGAGAFRCTRMVDALHEAFADRAGRLTLGSKKFERMDSSALDIEHAGVAAAYCDVFTCDQVTSQWIGDRRERLGLHRQVVRAEFRSDEKFVAALEKLIG